MSVDRTASAEPRRPDSPAELEILTRTGTGAGATLLSAFDSALFSAGVANFNLIKLSSVIPAHARISHDPRRLEGHHGDMLYCVYATAYASRPGEIAWAGLGWVRDEAGRGLFVEHTGGSREMVEEQIHLSLTDMAANRGGGYGEREMLLTSVHFEDRPVCALALAAYQVRGWEQP